MEKSIVFPEPLPKTFFGTIASFVVTMATEMLINKCNSVSFVNSLNKTSELQAISKAPTYRTKEIRIRNTGFGIPSSAKFTLNNQQNLKNPAITPAITV